MKNLDSVTLHGKTYPIRKVEIFDYGIQTIGPDSLEADMLDEDGFFVSLDAENLDDRIFFYAEDELLTSADDETLRDHVENMLNEGGRL